MNTISPSTSSMTTYIQTYNLCEYLRQNNFDASKAFRASRLTYIHKCLKDERSDLRYCMLWASGDFTEVANMETIQIWFVVNSMLRVPCVGVVQCVHTIHSTNKGNPWCGGHYPHHRGSSATRWSIMWNLNHSGLLLWFFVPGMGGVWGLQLFIDLQNWSYIHDSACISQWSMCSS